MLQPAEEPGDLYISFSNLYQGGAAPHYQWVDDLEIWNGFPPAGDNPPYAAH